MRYVSICICLACLSGSVQAEFREWTFLRGKTLEAEFTTLIAGKVCLKTREGEILRIPVGRFSSADQGYIQLQIPPQLSLDFSKQTTQRQYPNPPPPWGQLPRSIYHNFSIKIKQTSAGQYDHELVVEYFVVGEEIDGDKRTLLDYQKNRFFLTEESNRSVEFSGKRVELSDFYIGGYHRGTKYGGHLIVVTDSRGEIIAHRASSKNLFKNLENLRTVPVSKYFDDTCVRCFPTSPKRFY